MQAQGSSDPRYFLEAWTPMMHGRQDLKRKKVLNVGGNSKAIPLPPQYAEFEHVLLDIDAKAAPDIVCDARQLATLGAGQFDAVYCSHNLEHYYHHDVPRVLAGFLHVLKDDGFAQIVVPDIGELMRLAVERGLDIDDGVVESPAGPITVLEVLYGHSLEIERSGQDFFSHKTGFTEKSLLKALHQAGYAKVYSAARNLEIDALAFKTMPGPGTRALFNLPDG